MAMRSSGIGAEVPGTACVAREAEAAGTDSLPNCRLLGFRIELRIHLPAFQPSLIRITFGA